MTDSWEMWVGGHQIKLLHKATSQPMCFIQMLMGEKGAVTATTRNKPAIISRCRALNSMPGVCGGGGDVGGGRVGVGDQACTEARRIPLQKACESPTK